MGTYNVGSLVRISNGAGFKNAAGSLADPTTVKVKVTDPTGTATIYTYLTDAIVIKDSTGLYHADIDTTAKPGRWVYRWYAPPGTGQAAQDQTFTVTQYGW